MDKALYDRGMTMRRKVLGDEYVDRAVANTDDFNRQFQECSRPIVGAPSGATMPQAARAQHPQSRDDRLGRMHEFEAHFRGPFATASRQTS